MEGEDQAEVSPGVSASVIPVWGQYSKERYDAEEKRLADLRNWARQLATGVGAVIGLGVVVLGYLLKVFEAHGPNWALCCVLVLLLGSLGYQVFLLCRVVGKGYIGEPVLGPESPVVLADHLSCKEEELRRLIAAYYAKAAANVHGAAEGVAAGVRELAEDFARSLKLMFLGLALTAVMAALFSGVKEEKKMSDTPVSVPGSAVPAPAPTPAVPASPAPAAPAPAPASPLATPTAGQYETRSGPPARETMLATPTAGQVITEGVRRGGSK